MRAKGRPDGSFDVRGARYRLVDRADGTFDVVAERDGTIAGSLRMGHAGEVPEATVEPGAVAAAVMKAIARLLSSPRGALPLQ